MCHIYLTKSNASTWGPIFDANKEYLLEAIDLYIENLKKFKHTISNNNIEESTKLMLKANEISDVLDGIVLNKNGAK